MSQYAKTGHNIAIGSAPYLTVIMVFAYDYTLFSACELKMCRLEF